MGRLLAVDYGKKRVGIAVSDTLQIIANGLTTVATPDLFRFLADYFAKEPVDKLIVGQPMQTDGQPSENMKRVQEFVARFRKVHPGMPVEWYDERFTSVLAHQAMIDGGLRKKARQDKALVDEISATIILRDYMESRR